MTTGTNDAIADLATSSGWTPSILVVEVHHPEGALGAAVAPAVSSAAGPGPTIAHLTVRAMPTSGSSTELLVFAGIPAPKVAAARSLVEGV